jgi:hypothetical protein
MLVSARSSTGDPEWGRVPTLLDNKVAVGTYFAVQQGINYNTPEESISKTIAIAAHITSTDISLAGNMINVWDRSLHSDGGVSTAYVVSTNTGAGTSFGSPSVLVKAGATVSFVINLLPGYVNAQFEGCGTKMVMASSGSTSFATSPITNNCTLTSTATKLPIYKVSINSSGGMILNFGGTETLTGKSMEIMSGDSIEMSLVPDLGYQLFGGTYEEISSSACPTKLIGNKTIRVTPTSDCKVNVKFVLNDYDFNGTPDKQETNFIVHSIEVAPKAMRESDLGKTDVVFTVAATGNQGKRADGTLVPIAKVAMRTFFSRSGIDGEQELIQLYDDGTHGDAKANDAIYTASFRPNGYKNNSLTFLQSRARTITSWVVLFDVFGNELRSDRPNLFSTEVVSTILKDSVPLIAPSVKVSNKVYRSANYIALVDPTYHRLPDDKWLTRNVAQYVSGSFDAALIFNYGATFGSNWSSLANVKRFAQGIGLSDEFDYSAEYGLPGICGVINIGAPQLNGYVFNHELGHCWSAWLRKPELLLANGGAHWITASETSIMGQNGISIDRSSGAWKKAFLGLNRTFSMLDLYLGGMANISEVPSMYYVNDPAVADGAFTDAPIPDSKVSYMTRADLVSVYGARSPAYDGRKKNFRILPIVVSSTPLNNAEHTLIELLLAHYTGNDPGNDGGGDSTPPSLSVACRNRCTLSTDIGSPTVQSAQKSSQLQTTPMKRAFPKIVTEQGIKFNGKLH